MGFIERLFGVKATEPGAAAARSSIQQQIESRLQGMPEQRARFLAAFAGLLGRVADADLEMSPEEMERIRQVLREHGGLDEPDADLVADVIHEQTKTLLGLENHIYTRVLRNNAAREQRFDVLRALFSVAAADDNISTIEDEEIRVIAKGLGLSHEEFVALRSEFAEKMSVLKQLPKR
ncbi:MAG: TerB family tellurite resistance protein [Candidatus Alcyoniella australis]|nr:TerB family tellurite resistance protein [Candidatus Alcyoniella australis]